MSYAAVPIKLSNGRSWIVCHKAGWIVAAHLSQAQAMTLARTLNYGLRAVQWAQQRR